jgi:type I restriction enzyme M protein
MDTSALVQKVWNFCHTLRDDGVGYGDYLEQLIYLLFLKMAHEYAQEPYLRETHCPRATTGRACAARRASRWRRITWRPCISSGWSRVCSLRFFSRRRTKFDAENWVGMDTDAKGDLYEGLLQKNAEDTKSGAGQFFTPRALIQAMVACMRPQPLKSIADPACGTGGFFLVANEWLSGTGDWIERNAAWLDYEAPKLDRKKSFPARRDISWQRNRAKYAPPVPDEPLFAQHRRAGRRTVGGAFRRADCRTEVARRLRAGQSAFR